MKVKSVVAVVILAGCFVWPLGSALAQEAEVAGDREAGDMGEETVTLVSMTFDDTPLVDVIKAFRDATGANIISSGTNLQGTVSVRLDNVPWREGLSSILVPQGLELVEQPANSGIYIVTTQVVVEEPRITKIFGLDYCKAEDVADLLRSTLDGERSSVQAFNSANAVIVSATEKQIEEFEEIIKAIDKPSPQVYIEVRFAELSAAASKKLGVRWDVLDGWGAGIEGLHAGMERNRGKVNSLSLKSGELQEVGVNADGTPRQSFVNNYVVPNEIVEAPGAGRLAESMNWARARGVGGQLNADDFRLVLSAFEQTDGVSIFSNPKIIVSNEREAEVDISTKIPNLTVTSSRTGTAGDQLDVSARLELIPGNVDTKDGKVKGLFAGEAFFYYGINMKVTPRISPSGLISVNIKPSISNLDGYYTFEGTEDSGTVTPKYPIIYMQQLQTDFSMMDGSTAVIGGLSRTTEDSLDSGIPGLRHIPWIGPRLFGWKSRQKMQKEIIIFVTVGVADPMDLPEGIGMPKNAILGRELLSGEMKEPGDRTKEEVMSLKDPEVERGVGAVKGKRVRKVEVKVAEGAAEEASEVAEEAGAAPDYESPLLQ